MAITHTHFDPTRDVIVSLRMESIRAAKLDLEMRDRLTLALREALRLGADINDLSESSGLTVATIRKRVASELCVLSDTDSLAGVA